MKIWKRFSSPFSPLKILRALSDVSPPFPLLIVWKEGGGGLLKDQPTKPQWPQSVVEFRRAHNWMWAGLFIYQLYLVIFRRLSYYYLSNPTTVQRKNFIKFLKNKQTKDIPAVVWLLLSIKLIWSSASKNQRVSLLLFADVFNFISSRTHKLFLGCFL